MRLGEHGLCLTSIVQAIALVGFDYFQRYIISVIKDVYIFIAAFEGKVGAYHWRVGVLHDAGNIICIIGSYLYPLTAICILREFWPIYKKIKRNGSANPQ